MSTLQSDRPSNYERRFNKAPVLSKVRSNSGSSGRAGRAVPRLATCIGTPLNTTLGLMKDESELAAWVETAAQELVQRHSLDEIEAILVSKGASVSFALKLVLLIPSAFAREHFEPQGIKFPDHFWVGPRGRFISRQYSAEPIYKQARLLARRWLAESGASLIMRVLDWSAEADAIRKAKDQGQAPEEMSAVHHGFEP